MYDYSMSCYGFPVNTLSPHPGRRPNRILPNNSQGPCACPQHYPNPCRCLQGLGVVDLSKYKMGALAVLGIFLGAAVLTALSR